MDDKALIIHGWAFAAGTSRRVDAQLCIIHRADEILLELRDLDGVPLANAPVLDVKIDPLLGRVARKLQFADGTVFETNDRDGFIALDQKKAHGILHRLESFGPHLVAFALACIGLFFIIRQYGLDLLVTAALAVTPPAIVQQMDKGTMQTVDLTLADPSALDEETRAHVTQIYQQIVAALPADDFNKHNFQLKFRSMPKLGPNAFALPGGTMVVTDQLVEAFNDDDIIAGIIGHEIGHVVEEHGLRRVYRALGTFFLVSFLAGDTGPLMEDVLLEGNTLLALSYSRDQESSADAFGVKLTQAAGFDPNGLRIFFIELNKRYGDSIEWLSTHPSHENRAHEIDALIDELN